MSLSVAASFPNYTILSMVTILTNIQLARANLGPDSACKIISWLLDVVVQKKERKAIMFKMTLTESFQINFVNPLNRTTC